MSALFTLDASVFTSVCNRREEGSAASAALLAAIRAHALPLLEPALLPIEVAAAVRRGCGDETLAREYAEALMDLPHLTLVPVETDLCREAVRLAAKCSLRGADAVYVATAERYGAVLVTLDFEQRQRAPQAVQACTPRDALRLVKR